MNIRFKLLALVLALAAGLAAWWCYSALITSGSPAPPPAVATSSGDGARATYQAEEKPGAPASPGATPCPFIKSYGARKEEIREGMSTSLLWATSGGEEVTITDLLTGTETNVPASGEMPVSPASSRSYRLTVRGPCGAQKQDVMVSVTAAEG